MVLEGWQNAIQYNINYCIFPYLKKKRNYKDRKSLRSSHTHNGTKTFQKIFQDVH